jgi:hypothetical protein
VAAAQRDLRLIRDYVYELRRAQWLAEQEALDAVLTSCAMRN